MTDKFFVDVLCDVFEFEFKDDEMQEARSDIKKELLKIKYELPEVVAFESQLPTDIEFEEEEVPFAGAKQFVYKPRMNETNRKKDPFCTIVSNAVFGTEKQFTEGSLPFMKAAESYALYFSPFESFTSIKPLPQPKPKPYNIPQRFYSTPRKPPGLFHPSTYTPSPTPAPFAQQLAGYTFPASRALNNNLLQDASLQQTGEMLLICQLLQTHISQAGYQHRLYQQQLQQGSFLYPGAGLDSNLAARGSPITLAPDPKDVQSHLQTIVAKTSKDEAEK